MSPQLASKRMKRRMHVQMPKIVDRPLLCTLSINMRARCALVAIASSTPRLRQWNRKTTKYTAHRCAQARCHAEPDELALDVPDAFAPCWIEPPAHSVVELEHIAR